ncbi:MAG: lactate utilization protein [Anaerovoracaceae bacterium]
MEKELIKRNELLAKETIKGLTKRGFEAYYCDSPQAAKAVALSLIPPSHVVSWGGSRTCEQLGIYEAIKETNPVIDRAEGKTPEEAKALMKKALLCDTFVTGANGITVDGQLFNIDGNGNRVAAMTFGPDSVIVIAGVNKISHNLESAIERARNVAAPTNAQRFDVDIPCKVNGKCSDCLSPSSICTYFSQIRRCNPPGRIKVILVNEELGF